MKPCVNILEEICLPEIECGSKLCFQKVRYYYEDTSFEDGFRFIWRTKNNHLQAHRGQARIPTLNEALEVITSAKEKGW